METEEFLERVGKSEDFLTTVVRIFQNLGWQHCTKDNIPSYDTIYSIKKKTKSALVLQKKISAFNQ